MRVAIIGTVGVPARYGGFETLVENILDHTGGNLSYWVYCSSKNYKNKRQRQYKNARLIFLPFKANGLQSIIYDAVSIIYALFTSGTLLVLGTSGCVILPFVRLFSKRKIIVNIDGLEHQRAKWSRFAKWFLKFSESLALRFASTIITDNVAIQQYVKEEYGKDSVMIEYGGDHVLEKGDDNILDKWNLAKQNFSFTVCRIEPENNINIILEAFQQMPDETLVIVGNWDKNIYGQELKQKYSNYKNIYIFEAIYDVRTLNGLRENCRCYVHGHSAGGTNPSLVEAMSLGLPIIAFDVVYNRETTENRAFYFKDSASLVENVRSLSAESYRTNALAMKDVAIRRYQWDNIVRKYESLFV
jgi:glycosyltransferase involved in cell wall biosynthesis